MGNEGPAVTTPSVTEFRALDREFPQVSLLMTTRNCREALKKTLSSVLTQDYPAIEIVIKDGDSTDGTVDVIRDFEAELKRRKEEADRAASEGDSAAAGKNHRGVISGWSLIWESGPDSGLYDGMNRAVEMSHGEILGVCNDRFTRGDAVSLLVETLLSENADAVHADLVYMDGKVCKRFWHMGKGNIRTGWMPAHPALYVRRSVYERYGDYDISMKSSSDYDFMIRILKDGTLKLAYIPKVLISMYWGGTSNAGLPGYLRNMKEAWKALVKNGIPFPAMIIFLRILRTLRQYTLAKQWQKRKNPYCC